MLQYSCAKATRQAGESVVGTLTSEDRWLCPQTLGHVKSSEYRSKLPSINKLLSLCKLLDNLCSAVSAPVSVRLSTRVAANIAKNLYGQASRFSGESLTVSSEVKGGAS